MWLYQALSRLFPHSYTAKVIVVAFVGVHLPLLAVLAATLTGEEPMATQTHVLFAAFGATLVATGATILALRAVLRPVYRIDAAIRRFEETGEVHPLPTGLDDQPGRIMDATNRLILSIESEVDATRRAALTDPMTGLLNRRGLAEKIRGPAPSGGAMAMLAIDGFADIAARDGEAEANLLLRDLGRLLAGTLRSGDVLARAGGEEFAVFLPRLGIGEAREAAERLRGVISRQLGRVGRPVTVSIGLAMVRRDLDREALMAEAEGALAEARAGGSNRICVAVIAQGGLSTA